MSLDAPQKNKMMQAAPTKKGFHFSGPPAMYIEADNLDEARATYEERKAALADQQSTAPATEPEEKAVE